MGVSVYETPNVQSTGAIPFSTWRKVMQSKAAISLTPIMTQGGGLRNLNFGMSLNSNTYI